jgi:hypothetical protein
MQSECVNHVAPIPFKRDADARIGFAVVRVGHPARCGSSSQVTAFQWRLESPPDSGQFIDIMAGTFVDPATGMSFVAYTPDSPYMTIDEVVLNQHPAPIRFVAAVSNDCGTVLSRVATLTVCAADFNCSGDVSVQDIFDFLAAYFTGDERADINASGDISVQDIFDFLTG